MFWSDLIHPDQEIKSNVYGTQERLGTKKMEQKQIKHIKKCPVCNSTRITYNKGVMHCKKCGFINDTNKLKEKYEDRLGENQENFCN